MRWPWAAWRWLAAGANRRLRNLKLEQFGLLLLRAVLLAVLAGALAGPVWQQRQPASRGIVLLSADAARLPALASLQMPIDSLRRKGYQLRWLAAGFPKISGRDWQRAKSGPLKAASDSPEALGSLRRPGPRFAWARVLQATAAFAGLPLVVVTSATLPQFAGTHAPLPAAVSWLALPDTTTTAWLADAAQVGDKPAPAGGPQPRIGHRLPMASG